jgi:16S rRNA processing protein RimM
MDRIAIARIGKTHGVKGYVRLISFSGSYEHIYDISEAVIVSRDGKEHRVTIVDVRPLGDQVLVKLSGYDSPESVRVFSGSELWADRKHAAPLEQGEHYISQLVGCTLYYEGTVCGRVTGVAGIGHSDLLEVETPEAGFRYVPLKDEYIGTVDTQSRRIELRVGWILE